MSYASMAAKTKAPKASKAHEAPRASRAPETSRAPKADMMPNVGGSIETKDSSNSSTALSTTCELCYELPQNLYISSCEGSICTHKYCEECINTWLRKNPTCPFCRRGNPTIVKYCPGAPKAHDAEIDNKLEYDCIYYTTKEYNVDLLKWKGVLGTNGRILFPEGSAVPRSDKIYEKKSIEHRDVGKDGKPISIMMCGTDYDYISNGFFCPPGKFIGDSINLGVLCMYGVPGRRETNKYAFFGKNNIVSIFTQESFKLFLLSNVVFPKV